MPITKIYQVDAFTDRLFSGNPAAVCILKEWLSDDLMQAVANENNLAETAFVIPYGSDFAIRWFTPAVEVDLCGHATLASAFVLFNILDYKNSIIRFHSRNSGLLPVERKDDLLFLDFPTDTLEKLPNDGNYLMEKCIGLKPVEIYKGRTDYLAVMESQQSLQELSPDFSQIARLDARGLIVTAKGDHIDFVSRFFAPQCCINEDPVTGSAHTSLIPLWSHKLGKTVMTANQLSKRGGKLICELKGERCLIGGSARLYLTGEICLD